MEISNTISQNAVADDEQESSDRGDTDNSIGSGPEGDNMQDIRLRDSEMYASEPHPENFPDGGWEAYSVLIGSFFGLIADFGIPNGMGAIEAYISRHQLAHLKARTILWIFSLHLGIMFLGGVFFGSLFDRHGARKLLISGTALMFVGLLATAESKQLYQFILSFGITTALGTSLAMTPLIGVLSHWFLRKRAMVCSSATIGGLIGSSIFAVMLQSLYNSAGYKWAIRILAFVCLACMTVAIVLVHERRDAISPSPSNTPDARNNIETFSSSPKLTSSSKTLAANPDFIGAKPSPEGSRIQSCLRLRDSLSSLIKGVCNRLSPLQEVRFIALSIAVSLAEVNFMTISTFLNSFALAANISESRSYLLLTIVNLCGIPSRIATGILADQYGRFNVMFFMSIFCSIFVWGLLLSSNGRLSYLYAFAALYGMSSLAVMSLFAACLSQICPASQFGKHYGALYFFLAFSNILGMFASSLVVNNGSSHDYKMWIVFEGCISTACVLAWIWARWCNVKFQMCKF